MRSTFGCQIHETTYAGLKTLVYRGLRESDQQPVVLKVLNSELPSISEIGRYKHEFEITQLLHEDSVTKILSFEQDNTGCALVFEDIGGQSVAELIKTQPLGIEEILSLWIKATRSIGAIHAQKIVHKDITPSNIIYNRSTQAVQIIDFGISSLLPKEEISLTCPSALEGTLAYMAPEQTGRMNRSIDYRSDFYSLGASFYQVLTGCLPFESSDPLQVIHGHIARQPIAPCARNEAIPKVVSNIIMKLLEKNAENRYQGAWGLQSDLKRCLKEFQQNATVQPFELGTHDIPDQFQLRQILYGREQEANTILQSFDRVKDGGKEMMLVSGYSGIGKTSLIKELYKPMTQQRGYFISGKYDQFRKNVPFSAITLAFKHLIKQLLSEAKVCQSQWQTNIQKAVGNTGQIIIDLVPELEHLIGPQPDVEKLAPQETQNRFNLAFKNFIQSICNKEHPLIIFLDDLQWIDSSSLKLINLILCDKSISHLFLIGAYRNNEVNEAHPLTAMIRGMSEQGVIINKIALTTLKTPHILALCADALYRNKSDVGELVQLIESKTKGNPFFIEGFLNRLSSQGLIYFDREAGRWQWQLEKIRQADITDNVVDLMTDQIKDLSKSSQTYLSYAACMGN
ncbi:MAG: AAA family ATPase, partial [Gammaproteobacteria bacterium]|nr:AAA family ATPase [Gammaproteobacteria bacterium]